MALLDLPHLRPLGLGQTRSDSLLDLGLLQAAMQSSFGNPEVFGYLLDRGVARTGHGNNIITELLRKRLRHVDHPSSEEKSSQLGCQPKSGQTLDRFPARFSQNAL